MNPSSKKDKPTVSVHKHENGDVHVDHDERCDHVVSSDKKGHTHVEGDIKMS